MNSRFEPKKKSQVKKIRKLFYVADSESYTPTESCIQGKTDENVYKSPGGSATPWLRNCDLQIMLNWNNTFIYKVGCYSI